MSTAIRVAPAGGDTLMEKEGKGKMTQAMLDKLNVAQASSSNKDYLDGLGGLRGLAALLDVDLKKGLTDAQAADLRIRFGANKFPSPPMTSWLELFVDALKDPIIVVLIFASIISLVVGLIEDPHDGRI